MAGLSWFGNGLQSLHSSVRGCARISDTGLRRECCLPQQPELEIADGHLYQFTKRTNQNTYIYYILGLVTQLVTLKKQEAPPPLLFLTCMYVRMNSELGQKLMACINYICSSDSHCKHRNYIVLQKFGRLLCQTRGNRRSHTLLMSVILLTAIL